MSAPFDNRTAAKPAADALTSFLHIRCHPGDKAAWVRAAQQAGANLATWTTHTLNTAAADSQPPDNGARSP